MFPCNYWLHKLHIKSYNHCDQCGDIDSIEHFLVFCPVNKLFWEDLENWLKSNNLISSEEQFNIYNIIFGFLKSRSNILNYVCLQAKYYIYINRLKENKPHLSGFKDIVNRNLSIEKLICSKSCTIGTNLNNYIIYVTDLFLLMLKC